MMSAECDPELHKGNRVSATFIVKAARLPRKDGSVGVLNGSLEPTFACCDEHLAYAVRWVNTRCYIGGTKRRWGRAYVADIRREQ